MLGLFGSSVTRYGVKVTLTLIIIIVKCKIYSILSNKIVEILQQLFIALLQMWQLVLLAFLDDPTGVERGLDWVVRGVEEIHLA